MQNVVFSILLSLSFITQPNFNSCSDFYENHPVKKLYDAGVKITVNSDDPPFFNATIQGEYDVMSKLGLSNEDLKSLTRNAIQSSFLANQIKEKLLTKLS